MHQHISSHSFSLVLRLISSNGAFHGRFFILRLCPAAHLIGIEPQPTPSVGGYLHTPRPNARSNIKVNN